MKDETGKEETHPQRYWRILWSQRPTYAKEIPIFYKYLQSKEKKKELQYKLVKIQAIYSYRNRFNWEEWWQQEIMKNLDNKTLRKTTDTHFTLLNFAEDETTWFSEFMKAIKSILTTEYSPESWKSADTKEATIKIQLLRAYKECLKFINTSSPDIDETYNVLSSLRQSIEGDDSMSNFERMLKKAEKEFKKMKG